MIAMMNVHAMFLNLKLYTVKPEAEFYQKMMDKLGVNPDEICFVDDTQENIVGANNVGIIHTIHTTKVSNTLALIETMLNSGT